MHNPPSTALEAVWETMMETTHGAEADLDRLGLTLATAYALWAIDPAEPPPTMGVLAQRLRCAASSLTFISDRLVKLDYVTRAEDPRNRRYRVLSLTDAGRAARQEVITAFTHASPVSNLSAEDQQELVRILGKALAGGKPLDRVGRLQA
ncbi:MarR family winged helix-turn-helix transcriptional regulator [Kutzneria sp. CA-103260]|uniref:MarR family winged helix-turn-helix transcriptional regulator n=1 Tax=Kutzneria sp. CA-103260 TaxID=2802641 RepID=UPI001BA76BC0|nr:MarR family transcriptional regulator [Kutzneria sp. CA-103260]QUQ70199.1 MarR family protein [Kutzneria sp. CA-103260]